MKKNVSDGKKIAELLNIPVSRGMEAVKLVEAVGFVAEVKLEKAA